MEESALFGVIELLDELSLLARDVFWNFNIDRNNMWAALGGADAWRAVARKLEVSAWLRTGRDFHGNLAIDRLDVNFRAKNSVNHRNCNLGKNEVTLAREALVGANANLDIKVAALAALLRGWAALSTEANLLTVINAGRNL